MRKTLIHEDGRVEAKSRDDPHLTDMERNTVLPKRGISIYRYRHALAFGRCPRMVESGQ